MPIACRNEFSLLSEGAYHTSSAVYRINVQECNKFQYHAQVLIITNRALIGIIFMDGAG